MKDSRSFSARRNIKEIALFICTLFLLGFMASVTGCDVSADYDQSSIAYSLSIDASEMKTSYLVGEKLSLKGLKVYAIYFDGKTKEINDYRVVPPYYDGYVFTSKDADDCTYAGHISLALSYQNCGVSIPLYVSVTGKNPNEQEKEFTLEIKAPSKTEYEYGERLNLSGLIVTAVYKDGTTKTITDYECYPSSDTELNTIGERTISVSYQGVSATFKITVVAPSGNKCPSYFWGKWVRMDTGKMYEVLETAVKAEGKTYEIISATDDQIVVNTLGTFSKKSDRILNNINTPYFRYGGTNLEYSLKIVGFSDGKNYNRAADSRAVSAVNIKGIKGVGKSNNYSAHESEGESDENGILKLVSPTANDTQTVTITDQNGGLIVIPNITVENAGDYMGTVTLEDEERYKLKVTGVIDESQKDDGYLFGQSAKTYVVEISIENISEVNTEGLSEEESEALIRKYTCTSSTYEITSDDPNLIVEPYDSSRQNKLDYFIKSLEPGSSHPIKVKVTYGNMTEPKVDCGLNIKITNPPLNSGSTEDQEWTDYIPFRFYRGLVPISIAADGGEDYAQDYALNGFVIYPDGNSQFFSVPDKNKEVLLVPTFGKDKEYLLVFCGATTGKELSKNTEMFYTVSPGSSSVLTVDIDSPTSVLKTYMNYGGENQSEDTAFEANAAFQAFLAKTETDYWKIKADSEEIFAPGGKNLCNVSFISDYGKPSPHSSFFITEGKLVSESQIPTIECPGMEFLGWYTPNGTQLVAGTQINSDIEYKAHWDIANYEISYELGKNLSSADVAENSSQNPSYYQITSETITFADPSRPFYKFEGWYLDSDFSEDKKITEIPSGSTGEITVYAKWSPVTYTLKLHSNRGSFESLACIDLQGTDHTLKYDEENDVYTLTYNYETRLIIPSPTRAHYGFTGWYSSKDNADNENTEEEPLEQIFKTHGDLNLWAGWSAGKYKITYEMNGWHNNPDNRDTFTYETETFELLNPTSRNGYEFEGWFTSSDFKEETKLSKIEQHTEGDIVLYAKWKLLKYKLDYVLGSVKAKNADSNPSEYTIEDGGESKTIQLADPTFGKHKFLGWDAVYHDVYSGDTTITDYTCIPTTDCTDITLYAKWDIETFDIEYNFNLSSHRKSFVENPDENPTSYTEEDEALTILDASCPGYTFKGWHLENLDGEIVTKINPELAKKVTLIAEWKIDEYEIEYNLAGGTNDEDNRTKYTVEDAVDSVIWIYDAGRDYYNFVCWQDENGTEVEKIEADATGNLKLTAVWEPVSYSISYQLYGGTNAEENPHTFTVESETLALLDANRENFTFEGWYTSTAFTASYKITEIPSGSHAPLVLYAKWEKINGMAGGITVNAPTETDIPDLSAPTVTANENGIGQTIKFSVPTSSGYTSYKWYVDDSETPIATGNSCSINTANTSLRGGEHVIVLEAEKNGKIYSATWEFSFVK